MLWCTLHFTSKEKAYDFANSLPEECMALLVDKSVHFWDRRSNACEGVMK